jgi:hypothetical protein
MALAGSGKVPTASRPFRRPSTVPRHPRSRRDRRASNRASCKPREWTARGSFLAGLRQKARILAWARPAVRHPWGAEVRFHPLPTYRSNKRANNSGRTRATLSLWMLLTCRQKGDDHEEDSRSLRPGHRIHHWHGGCDGRCRHRLIPMCGLSRGTGGIHHFIEGRP